MIDHPAITIPCDRCGRSVRRFTGERDNHVTCWSCLGDAPLPGGGRSIMNGTADVRAELVIQRNQQARSPR